NLEKLEPMIAARPHAQADCGLATTSEGDSQLRADTARTTFSLDGSGVTVGILSDSYDNHTGSPVTTATTDISTGDLPGAGNPCGRLTAVNVLSDTVAGTDEGRALAQIVHDLAPGADLAFATARVGQFGYADNIRDLQAIAGADIIVEDYKYPYEPFYQDGPIAVAISDVVQAGAIHLSAAGNSNVIIDDKNVASYESLAYRPATCPTVSPSLSGGDCHDFAPGVAITDTESNLTLADNGYINLVFQWNDPWYGVSTKMDVYLVDIANTVVASSTNLNNTWPAENFYYQNTSGSSKSFDIVIHRATGSGTPRLKYLFLRSSGIITVEYNVSNGGDIVGPTVWSHAGAKEALSIAAAPYYDDNTPETFTSRGSVTYTHGPVTDTNPAAALASPETRQKPDVAATDRGCNTFFGTPPGTCYRFSGTSASAPHAAGVAALMKQRANQFGVTLTQTNAESHLESTARAMSSGSQEANGAGLIDAFEAVSAVVTTDYDVQIVKSVTPASILAGQNQTVTYTLAFTNGGALTTTGVIITDIIPSELKSVSVISGGPIITQTGSPSFTWQVADLGPAEKGIITISGIISTGIGSIDNTASITADIDEDAAKNRYTVTLEVVEAQADLGVSKSVTPTFTDQGTTITYTIIYSNNGLSTATEVVITDTVPSELANVGFSKSGPDITETGTISFTWLVADLAPGDSGIITITGVISGDTGGFTNTVTITSATKETNPDDNSSKATISVRRLVVDKVGDVDDGNYTTGQNTLREAYNNALSGETITFDAGIAGQTIRLDSTLTLAKDVTIDGGTTDITVSGDSDGNGTGDVQVVSISSGSNVTISGLTIAKGSASNGAGLLIDSGATITLSNSSLLSNTATTDGGAIYNLGTLNMVNSTIRGNSATDDGGAIRNSSTMSIISSTLNNNNAGNAVNNNGGAIYNFSGGALTITGSTVSSNSAGYLGGSVYNESSTVSMTNTTVSSSSAVNGGGIFNNGGVFEFTN
ncbi:MAG: DUF11 domain-containing protein, partial [Chloroflexi bacterium]|nr:DUF11 domain-containing protein [Chloroflexota bacterium]